MTSHSIRLRAIPCAAVVCLLAAFTVGPDRAQADISTPGSTGGEIIHGAAELQTKCYQHGTKIVDVGRLEGLNIGTLLRDSVLTLKRSGRDGASVVIVPLNETVCVVSAAP